MLSPLANPLESGHSSLESQYQGAGTIENPFVVDFGNHDRENPRTFPLWKKWAINILAALTMMTGTFSVSAYASGLSGMKDRFQVSSEVLAVGQTVFLIGLAFGSVIFPATADYFGRKRVVVTTMAVFTAFLAGVAAARNIATVLVCRFFAGLAAAAGQTLIPAQVSSLWVPKELAVPFTTAAIAPFLGPSLGPLLGGYVFQYSGNWRNIDWLAMAMAGLFTILYLVFIPETFAPYILRKRSRNLSKTTGRAFVSTFDQHGRKSFRDEMTAHIRRPIKYLFTEPIVTTFTLYLAFLYGVLNLFFEAFPYIYQTTRHYAQGNAGLPFIALLIGFALSVPVTIACGIPYGKAIERHGRAAPELRLIFAMVSAVLLPISLFWIAWTGTPSVSWGAPVVAGGIFGFAQIGLQMSVYTYLADVYGMTTGAAFAALNFVRFTLSSVFPLFSEQMYRNLGIGWASSVVGFILVVFLPAPFLFYRFGPRIRSWSPTNKS